MARKMEHLCNNWETRVRRAMEKYVRLNTRGSSGQSVQRSTEQKAEPTAHPFSPSLLYCLLSFSIYPFHPTTYSICLAVTFPHQHEMCSVKLPEEEAGQASRGCVCAASDGSNSAQQGGNPLHGAGHVAGHAFKSELKMCLQIVLNLKRGAGCLESFSMSAQSPARGTE